MENENKITVDNVDYNIEDLNDKQKYLVAQIQSVRNKINSLRFDLDQFVASESVFSSELTKSLNEDESDEADIVETEGELA
jgi:hypothetical protein